MVLLPSLLSNDCRMRQKKRHLVLNQTNRLENNQSNCHTEPSTLMLLTVLFKIITTITLLITQTQAQEDYTKYLFYAMKYGPLDGLMYCCSGRPGRGIYLLHCPPCRKLEPVILLCHYNHSVRGSDPSSCHRFASVGQKQIGAVTHVSIPGIYGLTHYC